MPLRSFAEIHALAAARKGGEKALETLLATPRPASEIAATPDDRILSAMSKCVFQAGFNWKVVENMWPGFETVFEGFEPIKLTHLGEEDLDTYLADTRIVRHSKKILSVFHNARFVLTLSREHGCAAKCFAGWNPQDYAGLLDLLKNDGGRLGGMAGQIFLRRLGVESFVLSKDVLAALSREGVLARPAMPGRRDLAGVQAAFNQWRAESGRPLTQISQILAFSIEPP